jgi:hypothetical protein
MRQEVIRHHRGRDQTPRPESEKGICDVFPVHLTVHPVNPNEENELDKEDFDDSSWTNDLA